MPTSRGMIALALSPLVILIASGTRLLVMANYDTTTATTVAASGGLGETLLGTIVPLLPPFLPAVCVILAIFRQWFLLAFAGLSTAIVSPAYATAPAGWEQAYSSFRVAVDQVWHREWNALWQDSRLVVICAAAGAFLVLYDALISRRSFWMLLLLLPVGIVVAGVSTLVLLFVQNVYRVPFDATTYTEALRRPWLAPEEIVLNTNKLHIGYMVSDAAGWHTVLNESNRTITYIRVRDVAARKVCRVGPAPPTPPAPLIRLEGVQAVQLDRCADNRE